MIKSDYKEGSVEWVMELYSCDEEEALSMITTAEILIDILWQLYSVEGDGDPDN